MNDASADPSPSHGVTRWWRNLALARAAFGSATFAGHDAAGTTEPDLADPAQREFGEYELLELIGRGGMGLVYRARQRGLAREVAIKLLSGGPWAKPEFVARFEQEARHAAQLQHPGIVAIHELGESVDGVYYAMQLVRGESLAQRLHDGDRWTPREAAAMLRQIAEAVAYAHSLGVLHLDLKPGNVLIDEDGHPLIADFGLARRIEAATDDGFVAGTPGYMAPEQAIAGHPLNETTDVWGLGAILHELLNSLPPHDDEDEDQLLAAAPADLRAICRKCLAHAPRQRYASARALADDLGRFLDGRAVQARPLNSAQRLSRWARREPRLVTSIGLAIVILLVGTAATALQWRRAEASARAARQQTWDVRGNIAWEAIRNGHPFDAVPPLLANLQEQTNARDASEARENRVRVAAVLAQSPRLIDVLPAGQPITSVAIDPDGRWIAIGTERGQVQLFDVHGGSRRWVAETADATHFWQTQKINVLTFSKDGRHLIAGRPWSSRAAHPSGQDQVLIELDSGQVRLPPASRCPGFVDASYSPGGYAVIRCRDASGKRWGRLVLTDPNWTPLGPLHRIDNINPLWQLAPGSPQIAQSTSTANHIEVSKPGSLESGYRVAFPSGAHLRAWTFNPDGTRLTIGFSDGQVWLVETGSGKHTRLATQSGVSVAAFSYSADGRWLAVARDNGQAEVWDIVTGRTLADPVRHGDGPFSASVDASSGLLFTADSQTARLWQLPRHGSDIALLATVPTGSPHGRGTHWYGAAAYHPAQNLLVTRQIDGQARLWRVRPQAAALPFKPPPLLGDYAFDGHHILAGDGSRLQVRDYQSLRPLSPQLEFPQPAGLTLPLADGSGVLVASGHSVHLRNLPNGQPRWPPIDIDNTPVRLLASPAGASWAASHLAGRAGRSVEVIETFSIVDGKRLARLELPGPLHGLRFSADGKWLFAWRLDALHVLDAGNLHPRWPALAVDAPTNTPAASSQNIAAISDAALDADGKTLWVSSLETVRPARLFAINLRSGRTQQAWQPPGIPMRLYPLPESGRLVLQTQNDGPYLFDRMHGFSAVGTNNQAASGVAAISGDGRRLAAAMPTAIIVHELVHGRMLTPPLQLPAMKPGDRVTQLLFDAHGERLLARTLEGRWFHWDLVPDTTPAATLQRLSSLMQPHDTSLPATASAQDRAWLRARDPGPMRGQAPPAMYAMPHKMLEPRFVDLRPRCNDSGIVGWAKQDLMLASHWPVFPHGRLRLLGQDYEVHCAINVSMLHDYQISRRIAGLKPALPRFTALHVLITGVTSLQDRAISPYAIIELRYRDGSKARLSAFYRRDLLPWWAIATKPPVPVPALLGREDDWQDNDISLWPLLYSVDLQNPHPEREVVELALEATPYAWSRPAVLAITLDPAVSATTSRNAPPTHR